MFEEHLYLFSGLRNAAREIPKILAEIPDAIEGEPLAPGEWSPHQIITHVCDVNELVYFPRLQRIIEETNPQFEEFDGDAWMAAHYDADVPMPDLVRRFSEQADEIADWLEDLSDEDWQRPGTHPSLGTHPLAWWADRMVAHTTEHMAQLRGD